MQSIFDNTFPEVKSMENVISKISATSDCRSSKERVALNQDLKNQLDDEFISVSIENGVIKINTFKITYRKE